MAIIEILQQYALISLLGISILLSLVTTLIYKYATNQSVMKELKADLKKYQEQMKSHRDNPTEVMEIQKKAMEVNTKYMKQSFKPMFITLIPFLIIFYLLKMVYDTMIIIPLSFWQGHLGWVGSYIIFSMVFTSLFRKALKVA
jgi:uncharacterized membrane protein (DUF106 family)